VDNLFHFPVFKLKKKNRRSLRSLCCMCLFWVLESANH